MNDSILRKFCESPYRKVIVAIVTTVFGLLVMIPLVDDYFDKKESRNTLTDELEIARQTAQSLPDFEERVAGIVEELELVEAREVSETEVSAYRNKLIDLVRKSGCQLRRIDVSLPTVRPWFLNDDPLRDSGKAKQDATPFSLERRSAVLFVDGPMESTQAFLKELHNDKSFAVPSRLEMRSTSGHESKVTLEIELWLFALARKKV